MKAGKAAAAEKAKALRPSEHRKEGRTRTGSGGGWEARPPPRPRTRARKKAAAAKAAEEEKAAQSAFHVGPPGEVVSDDP